VQVTKPFFPATYASLGYRVRDFPETEKQSQRVQSLPMFAELTEEQIKTVAEAVLSNI